MVVQLEVKWNSHDKYISLATRLVKSIQYIEAQSGWNNNTLSIEPRKDRIFIYGRVVCILVDKIKEAVRDYGEIVSFSAKECAHLLGSAVDIYVEIMPYSEHVFVDRTPAPPVTFEEYLKNDKYLAVQDTDIDVDKRIKENQILIEIKTMSDLLEEHMPLKAFNYSHSSQNASFNLWMADAVRTRNSLKEKIDRIKANIKATNTQDEKTQTPEDETPSPYVNLGTCLDSIGMNRDTTPSKETSKEIRRRISLHYNRMSSRDISQLRRTLKSYGFYRIRRSSKRRETKEDTEGKKEEEKEEERERGTSEVECRRTFF